MTTLYKGFPSYDMTTIGLPTIHPAAASVAMQNLHMSIKEPFCCCQDIKVRVESIKASERYRGGL